MAKIIIGQTVYLKPTACNNMGYEKPIQEFEVKKIGKKYFEVWKGQNKLTVLKFDVETLTQLKYSYFPDWNLYFSKQEILDEKETMKLTDEIRNVVDRGIAIQLSLEQLRKIKDIIDNG